MDPKQQAEEKLDHTSEEKKQEILDSFQGFLDYLNKQVNRGEKLGLGEEQLAKGAERVAEYLKNHEEPRNSEEKLLQEMWQVAEEEEKRHIARTLVRLAQKEGNA
ncbi:DUF3243 domain-containing protein [Alkalicoccus luteus]|uniref:DUF3243 domain-containing protein n=1 Tax=Alkalicoccus luteus TaxID=1237094 RepID=A0A969TUI3_9BACI|nr:DUF3243 domain-containing protein [Alkalicoccus luteus]NJP37087.1 DUF3243 domain-containing protein [Alkalicoccus luteus]